MLQVAFLVYTNNVTIIVMIGDDDNLFPVPHLCIAPELTLENAYGARPAYIVRQQNINVHPYVFARRHGSFSRCAGQYLFSNRVFHNSEDCNALARKRQAKIKPFFDCINFTSAFPLQKPLASAPGFYPSAP